MKPSSFIPGGKMLEAASIGAHAAAARLQIGVEARNVEIMQGHSDIALTDALLAHETTTPDALTAHSAERTRQVSVVQDTLQKKETTKQLFIAAVIGTVLVGGGVVTYAVHEAAQTVQAGANAVGKIGDGLKYAFTPHDVSAVEVQNVIDGYSFPGLVPPVEEAHMHGNIVVHDQGDFLKISLWQGNDVPASVCGTETVSADLANPGVITTAVKDAKGNIELNLQIPVGEGGALSSSFTEDPGTKSDFMGPCTDPGTNGEPLNNVGAQEQGIVHKWEAANLPATCAQPVVDNLRLGLTNTQHAFFAAENRNETQIDSMAGLSPKEQAKLKYIRNLLTTAKINISYVNVVPVKDGQGAVEYQPVAQLTASDIPDFPTTPSKQALAKELQIDPAHMTFPTLNETQCLMTATAVQDQVQALTGLQPPLLNPTANASTLPSFAGKGN